VHANELIKSIVSGIHHHTEGEREAMLAAVDLAFPVKEPEPETPVDGDQAPPAPAPAGAPVPAGVVFSDTPGA